MASTYTDDQGRFGFYALPLDLYYVDINDDSYQTVHERAMLSPFTSSVFLQLTLVPKTAAKGEKPAAGEKKAGAKKKKGADDGEPMPK